MFRFIFSFFSKQIARIQKILLILKTNGALKAHTFNIIGFPDIQISRYGKLISNGFLTMVSKSKSSTLGKCNPCKIVVYNDAELHFGGNVGMSNVTIIATKQIFIGKNVLIGGGVTIVDTDFHSLNSSDWFTPNDEINMKRLPVYIGDNVFIGMDSIILKGVTIGNNSIIAAGSVVTKSIPANEIWGGNPAVFIRKR